MNITEDLKLSVWNKGTSIQNYDNKKYRQDQCGAWMKYGEYGNRNSIYGWEIDHITPQSIGGNDNLSNLRPLQWQNNLEKSNGRLFCKIISNGNKNINKLVFKI